MKDELAKCHKAEGVNHYENCAWLSEKYLSMLKENRVRFLVRETLTFAEPRNEGERLQDH